MPVPADLVTRLKKIVAKELECSPEDITPESNFMDDLGADSLDTVELVMAVEEEFHIDVPDDEADKVKTFGDMVAVITKHLQ